MTFEPTQIFHLRAGRVSCVGGPKREDTSILDKVHRKEKSENTSTTYHLNTSEEDLYFMEKLKFQNYFHWYVILDNDKLHGVWWERRGTTTCKWWSDQDACMTSSCCVPFRWAREAFLSHVPLISKQIIIVTLFSTVPCSMPEKNIIRQSLLHTEALPFTFLDFMTQLILMKFEILCHFNHALPKLYLLSQHNTCTHTHIAIWLQKVHSKQWTWGMIFCSKHIYFPSSSSPSKKQKMKFNKPRTIETTYQLSHKQEKHRGSYEQLKMTLSNNRMENKLNLGRSVATHVHLQHVHMQV